jgi:hypothetical protein
MPIPLLAGLFWSACGAVGVWVVLRRSLGHRIGALERDLQSVSEIVSQMAEIHIRAHECSRVETRDGQERAGGRLPRGGTGTLDLDLRHQVLALAGKGVALDEIVHRLKVSRGAAESILNLRKLAEAAMPRACHEDGGMTHHDQA